MTMMMPMVIAMMMVGVVMITMIVVEEGADDGSSCGYDRHVNGRLQ